MPAPGTGRSGYAGRVIRADDLHAVVADQFGTGRRLATVERLTGGSKKGVYRLALDDATTAILYLWAASENYWPSAPSVADDPFTDANGIELFVAAHDALAAADVRAPRMLFVDRDRRYLDADLALVEDAGGTRLETLMQRDPTAAAAPLAALGEALRRMHTTTGPRYGKVALLGSSDEAQRPANEVILNRALLHLDLAAARVPRLADARDRIAAHLRSLGASVSPRSTYALVHGELGPDHVLVTPSGEPILIDIEGLAYFDVEWEHAWLRVRFGDAYPALNPVPLDPERLELYRYAQVLSLIEGPLRIADTDFPDRAWMLQLAEWNIDRALAAVA
jgi:aminoglycoside phosphotransferase (APT) family kinase protein